MITSNNCRYVNNYNVLTYLINLSLSYTVQSKVVFRQVIYMLLPLDLIKSRVTDSKRIEIPVTEYINLYQFTFKYISLRL